MAAKPLPYLVGTSFRPRRRGMPAVSNLVDSLRSMLNEGNTVRMQRSNLQRGKDTVQFPTVFLCLLGTIKVSLSKTSYILIIYGCMDTNDVVYTVQVQEDHFFC